jgi:hypothetical protein
VEVDVDHGLRAQPSGVGRGQGGQQVGGERHGPAQAGVARAGVARAGVGLLGAAVGGGGLVGVVADAGDEQGEELGGAGEQAEGQGVQLVAGQVRVLGGEQVGCPGEGGVDPDGVAGVDLGDDHPQAVLVGAGQGDVAAAGGGGDLLGVRGGVGLDDLGLRELEDPAGGLGADRLGDRGVDQGNLVQR